MWEKEKEGKKERRSEGGKKGRERKWRAGRKVGRSNIKDRRKVKKEF